MGAMATAAIYSAYILLLFAIAISLKSRPKSDRRVLDEFFSYVRIGRKRAAMLQDHLLAFALLQLAYPIIALLIKVPAYLSFGLWFAISFTIYYFYCLSKDIVKKIRHNGIAIGYEYPHPVENKAIRTETQTTSNLVMGGSKGIYDLQIKSEPNPHIMIIGATGMGKSNLITTLLARSYLKFKIPFLIIDWSGAYSKIDVNVWTVPTNLRVNPFLLRGKSIERRAGIASELLQIALGLTDMQTQKVRETLDLLYHEGSEPSIQMLHNRLVDEISTQRYKETKLQLTYITNKLRQAYEIFGQEPREFWDNYDKSCNIVSLAGLTDLEKKLVTHTIMQRITEEFKGESGTRLYIALDDAYQALLSYFGKETNITRIVREGRKYGFGLVIATQLLQDMPEAIPANTAVKFILGYHESSTLQRLYSMLRLSELERSILFRIPVGHALLFDQNAIQNGKPNPAYVEVDVLGKDEGKKLAEGIEERARIYQSPGTRLFFYVSDITHATFISTFETKILEKVGRGDLVYKMPKMAIGAVGTGSKDEVTLDNSFYGRTYALLKGNLEFYSLGVLFGELIRETDNLLANNPRLLKFLIKQIEVNNSKIDRAIFAEKELGKQVLRSGQLDSAKAIEHFGTQAQKVIATYYLGLKDLAHGVENEHKKMMKLLLDMQSDLATIRMIDATKLEYYPYLKAIIERHLAGAEEKVAFLRTSLQSNMKRLDEELSRILKCESEYPISDKTRISELWRTHAKEGYFYTQRVRSLMVKMEKQIEDTLGRGTFVDGVFDPNDFKSAIRAMMTSIERRKTSGLLKPNTEEFKIVDGLFYTTNAMLKNLKDAERLLSPYSIGHQLEEIIEQTGQNAIVPLQARINYYRDLSEKKEDLARFNALYLDIRTKAALFVAKNPSVFSGIDAARIDFEKVFEQFIKARMSAKKPVY